MSALDTLGCEYSTNDGFLEVKRGAMIATSEKVKNLYNLIGKTAVSGVVKVEPHQEESSFVVKEVGNSENIQQDAGDNWRQSMEEKEN